MNEILNWIGLISVTIGFVCFGIIGFKRSAWWGPSKSVTENLDSTEMSLMKIGFIIIVFGILIFVISNC
jgi:hypothetical protein